MYFTISWVGGLMLWPVIINMLHNNRISVQYDVHDVEHAELIDAGFVLVQLTVGHSKYQFCSFIRAPQAMVSQKQFY